MGFKVNILDRNNQIEHVYVYGVKEETIFSETELNRYTKDKSEIHYEAQQIHYDDSIRVIKNKIFKAIGVSYKEIYMFGRKSASEFVPVGNKLTQQLEHMFSINPLDCNTTELEVAFYTFDNLLLFNYSFFPTAYFLFAIFNRINSYLPTACSLSDFQSNQ